MILRNTMGAAADVLDKRMQLPVKTPDVGTPGRFVLSSARAAWLGPFNAPVVIALTPLDE
jgi:hypothetical protein